MNALHRHEEERVEEVLQNLRAKGIRITDTRRAVLSYLVASHEPVSYTHQMCIRDRTCWIRLQLLATLIRKRSRN